MVYLSRLTTRTGDGGDTALGDGSRVPKDDPRIEAVGAVDELNAVLGLALAQTRREEPGGSPADLLRAVQNDLFDVGADLCVPPAADEPAGRRLRMTAEHILHLEAAVERLNAGLAPLTSFVLPGGAPAAAACHVARTVCRRAERAVVALHHRAPLNPHLLAYLNRLSDLLFVLARVLNDGGRGDVLWVPGGSSGQ